MFNELMPFSNQEKSLRKLHRDFHKVLSELSGHNEMNWADEGTEHKIWPKVDICETDKAIDIVVELPGVKEDEVKVNIQNNILTISGEKRCEKKEEKKEEGNKMYYRCERSYGQFMRTFPLPYEVKADSVEATFEKGLLKICIPKPTETDKSSMVKIKNKS